MAPIGEEQDEEEPEDEIRKEQDRSEARLVRTKSCVNLILGALAGISVAYMISRRTFPSMLFYDETVGNKYIALFVGCSTAGAVSALFVGDQLASDQAPFGVNGVCLVLIAFGIFVWMLPVVG